MSFLAGILMRSGGIGNVNLDGHDIIAPLVAGVSVAQLRFNMDGTVDENENLGGYVQIDPATDWIIPNNLASGQYEVRYTNLTVGAFSAEAAAEDVWIDLSADRQWTISRAILGTSTVTADFQIRRNGGAVLATAEYTLEANSSG